MNTKRYLKEKILTQ